MLDIVLLAAAIAIVVAIRRKRGSHLWVWGLLAFAVYFGVPFLFGAFLGATGLARGMTTSNLAAGAVFVQWLGLSVLFLLARLWPSEKQSGGTGGGSAWVCPNCKFLNDHTQTVCAACRAPQATAT